MERYSFSKEIQTAYERLPHPLAIYQYIGNTVVAITLSDGYCKAFGFDNQEQAYTALEENIYYNIHPEDVNRIDAEAYRSFIEHDDYEIVYRSRFYGGDEEYKVMHAIGKHIEIEPEVHLVYLWYEEETDEVTRQIKALQESVSSLLTNMPAMTFSKDLETRKYIACNQAFADYAHKETPAGVIGLTDFDIFDEKTAQHFIEDDQKAIAMEGPYIFYEDVPDAAGFPRQFQTTKLKFTNAAGRECLLGLCQDVTDAMRIKREYAERLEKERTQANIDALTGIRNKHAYLELEEKMNTLIEAGKQPPFAVTIFDVNNLKTINDTLGHQAGDDFIRAACRIICKSFKNSPVFRIGGDEFVAISEGEDYERLDELMDHFRESNEEAQKNGHIVIAIGTSRSDGEKFVSAVFAKADKNMYDNKNYLKSKE